MSATITLDEYMSDPDTDKLLWLDTPDLVDLLHEAINHLQSAVDRLEKLQKQQRHMRDPERQMVCEIIANGTMYQLPEKNLACLEC